MQGGVVLVADQSNNRVVVLRLGGADGTALTHAGAYGRLGRTRSRSFVSGPREERGWRPWRGVGLPRARTSFPKQITADYLKATEPDGVCGGGHLYPACPPPAAE